MPIQTLNDHPDAIPVLANWHHAQWSHLNPGMTLDDRISKMQAYLSDDFIPSTWVYLENGEITGSAAIVANDLENHPELTPWLASVYVAPVYRRQGIGSRLVRHVMQQARQQGYTKLYLFTPDKESFYASHGWSRLATERYHGEAIVIMQAVL